MKQQHKETTYAIRKALSNLESVTAADGRALMILGLLIALGVVPTVLYRFYAGSLWVAFAGVAIWYYTRYLHWKEGVISRLVAGKMLWFFLAILLFMVTFHVAAVQRCGAGVELYLWGLGLMVSLSFLMMGLYIHRSLLFSAVTTYLAVALTIFFLPQYTIYLVQGVVGLSLMVSGYMMQRQAPSE